MTLKRQFYLLSLIYIEEEHGIVIGKNASSNLFEHQYLHLSSVSGIILVPWVFTKQQNTTSYLMSNLHFQIGKYRSCKLFVQQYLHL